jgi:hypothetical protein
VRLCRAAEVQAAWEQASLRVFIVGVGPCNFFNDACPGVGVGAAQGKNNCELVVDPDKSW